MFHLCFYIRQNILQLAKSIKQSNLNDLAVFYKVDVDENSETSGANNISCMPTFIFFKDGAEVDRIEGADMDSIRDNITKYS